MRRMMDLDLDIAVLFTFEEHTNDSLESDLRSDALDYGADLLAAANLLHIDRPRTELLYHPFDSVSSAEDFLKRAMGRVEDHGVEAPTRHTIFNGDSIMTYETDDTQPGGYMIIDGESVFVPGATVRNFLETGLTFTEPRGVHPRPADAVVNKLVLHWTASERDGREGAESVLRNMSARRDAGCHFLITNDGVVWQFNDLVRDMTTHVSHRVVKPASIGFEVSGYGWAKDHSKVRGMGKDRLKYEATIHGWRTKYADYYPAQHEAVQAVCTAICEHMGIEKNVMLAPWRVRSYQQLRGFEGALGHLHCALGRHPKVDPGTRPLELLAKHWGIL